MKMNEHPITLCITGGHLTPALALIEEIEINHIPWSILFVGREYAMEGDTDVSREFRLIKEKHIRFLPLSTGRLQRTFTSTSLYSLLKIPIGFIQAFIYCVKERPTLIVSFGGYVALPMVIAGWLVGIPSVTHEQTRSLGLTNKLISFFVRKICISFSDMEPLFDKKKVVTTGLPIRAGIFRQSKKLSFSCATDKPLLYIVGGSTGSVSMNSLFFPLVSDLVKNFALVHQTGVVSLTTALEIQHSLPKVYELRYVPRQYVDIEDHSWLLQRATIVLGRSGANTVGELAALGKTAILIPLPWAADNEQKKNALWLSENGGCVVLNQDTLTPDKLKETIEMVVKEKNRYHTHAAELEKTFSREGARKFVEVIQQALSEIIEF